MDIDAAVATVRKNIRLQLLSRVKSAVEIVGLARQLIFSIAMRACDPRRWRRHCSSRSRSSVSYGQDVMRQLRTFNAWSFAVRCSLGRLCDGRGPFGRSRHRSGASLISRVLFEWFGDITQFSVWKLVYYGLRCFGSTAWKWRVIIKWLHLVCSYFSHYVVVVFFIHTIKMAICLLLIKMLLIPYFQVDWSVCFLKLSTP